MSKINVAKNVVLNNVKIESADFTDINNDNNIDGEEELIVKLSDSKIPNKQIVIKGDEIREKLKNFFEPNPFKINNLQYYLEILLRDHLKKESGAGQTELYQAKYTDGGVWRVYEKGIEKDWWWTSDDAQRHIDILKEAGKYTFSDVQPDSTSVCAIMYTSGAVWKVFLNGEYLDWWSSFPDAQEHAEILKNSSRCRVISSR